MAKLLISIILFLLLYSMAINNSYATYTNPDNSMINFQIELQHWKEVNKVIPRKAKFTVIDIETGKSFEVQRRAGEHHADVQPLTRKDTKIMKEIYQGHWSWRRRAILILANDRLIAASMHGMPHGAGALQNGFPGHFCIHFIGSTTHRTERSDLSHQLMILKGAGKIDEYLASATPNQVTDAFLVFVKNADVRLVKKVVVSNSKNIDKEIKRIKTIEAVRWDRKIKNKSEQELLFTKVPVDLQLQIKEIGPLNTPVSIELVRMSPLSPWKVDLDTFLSIIEESH